MAARLTCADGIQECLETLPQIKSNNYEDKYLVSLKEKFANAEKRTIFTELGASAFVSSAQMFLKLGIATTALIGGKLLIQGQIHIMTFFLYLFVVSRIYDPLQVALQNLMAIISLSVQTERMNEILQSPMQTGAEKLTNNGCDITFDHVSFSYAGADKKALNDSSFTIESGEHVALVGPSGGGKSTIVKLICGLYQPTEGNITINGIPLGSLNPAQYYKAIAAVFQDPFALSFSIAENVSCSPLEETDRNRCREALIRAGLWEKIASLPQKEETYLGKYMADDGITLSGGEMQKLMMARALYKNCHLLLLDEPTAALDAISENKMYETYSTLLKNKTALFISHRLASTRFCDTILFLENGKIKECGTHDELIALGGSYAHMFEVQSQYYQETEEDI